MREYDYYVAVITAVGIETRQYRQFYDDWKRVPLKGDGVDCFETTFMRNGETFKVVTAEQTEMGLVGATSLCHKMIYEFNPKYIIMVGIAGGIGEEKCYGDVIVADTVWNYSSGKFVHADESDISFGSLGFVPRPIFLHMDSETRKVVEVAKNSPLNQCHVHIGPMACGSCVVANSDIIEKQIKVQFPGVAGLDMESYAIMFSAQSMTSKNVIPIVVKGICDFADKEKSDIYQKFAAYTSGEFAKLLYEIFLPVD